MKRSLFFCLFALVAFSSCKKNSPKPGTENHAHGFDVYVLGQCGISYANAVAGYWKNGMFKALTDTNTWSYPRSMTVSGNDVYVAGYYLYNGGGYAANASAYWKNGTIYPMPEAAAVACVAVNRADVYIGGASWGSTGILTPTYWKNGIKHVLDIGRYAYIASISFNGNDVYMTGSMQNEIGYWLNDKFTSMAQNNWYLAEGTLASYVNGSDIYFCGQQYDAGTGYFGSYTKNGAFTQLTNGTAPVSIKVVGTDVYCAGTIANSAGGPPDAYYWKNGVASKLENSAYATNVAIDGTDVYASGYLWHGNLAPSEAVYWLNGNKVNLPNVYYKSDNLYTASIATQVVLVRY